MKKNEEFSIGISNNLKKSTTELLILLFLIQKPMTIFDILHEIDIKSSSACKITYPYSAIYRLLENGYIAEYKKMTAADGRFRQFFAITKEGKEYCRILKNEYDNYTNGINRIFSSLEVKDHEKAVGNWKICYNGKKSITH